MGACFKVANLLVLLGAISTPLHDARACACCVAPGVRREGLEPLEKWNLELIRKLRFGRVAWLVTTAASPDDIKAIPPDAATSSDVDPFAFNVAYGQDAWTIQFSNAQGAKGSLKLNFPPAFERFEVDIGIGRAADDDRIVQKLGKVDMFKEWRLSGSIRQGDGLFEQALRGPADFRLIFQGKGNACADESQFTFWQLMVTGPHAHFSFWGRLGG